MSNHTHQQQQAQQSSTKRFTPTDFNRIVEEIRRGGIHTVPAYLVSRWGLQMADARHLIKKHHNH